MKLKTDFWSFDLRLIKSNYTNNNKLYYWLEDKRDWEMFEDITVNLDWDYENLNFINRNFINVFRTHWEAIKRLQKNLKIEVLLHQNWYFFFIS